MSELTRTKPNYPTLQLPDSMTDQAIAVANHIVVTPCDTKDDWNDSIFDGMECKPDESGYQHFTTNIDGNDVTFHIHATQIARSYEDGPKQGTTPLDIRTFPQPEIDAFILEHRKVLSIAPPAKKQGIGHGDSLGT